MSLSIYVAAPEGRTGKSIVALGIIDALSRQVASIGVFRPLVKGDTPRDEVLESLLRLPGVKQDYASAVGVTYAEARANPDDVLSRLVNQYGELKERFDAIVVVGSDFAGTMSHNELALNAQFAANFGAPVVLTVAGKRHRTPEQVKAMALSALAELERNHARTIGIVATRLDQEVEEATLAELSTIPGVIVSAVETDPSLSSPTFGAQVAAVEGEIFSGRREQLQRESRGVMIAGMTLQNALKGLFQEATVVVPGDRFEMIPAILMAHNATTFPDLSGLILVGGYDLPDSITKLIGTIRHDLPIAISRLTTWQAAQQLFAVEGAMTNSPRKAELALAAVSRTIDIEGLLTRAAEVGSSVTPLMFEYKLNEMARRNKRTIVLPEAEDDRILTSAAIALKRGIANIILLGKPEAVTARAEELGLDLSQAQVVDPEDPEMLERFAAEYARLRAHKGVTVEAARARFADKSYIGTMMVHMGVAHGMVSGAVNTTANTIRPSLEFIKTKPGVKVVSSSFLMCMNDRVDVYADCAVNPNPTPEELADIAIGAAETAIAFDIEPRIAMLSYSTGTSGAGGDVEAVAEATRLVRERAPELAVEGPIQFDAAIDLTVGQKKMPGSAVAGRATVFIFPDLNTGNNTYKAVQRTAGAVAIGPVLQGLNKPVNDLSRGALVEDIVNTIAITAIQAQHQ